ncbi:hypothetical protein, partial [Vibrio anguillarum]
MNYVQLKQEIFAYFHSNLANITRDIQDRSIPQGKKSILINQAVESVKANLGNILIDRYPQLDCSKLFMLLQ